MLCISISAAASELEYVNNIFTDETSIEDDFQNLQMDINDYYKPNYNYSKWYVIAMSEAYANENYDIQTYFYIFNPTNPKIYEDYWQDLDDVGEEHYQRITDFKLKYTLSGTEKEGFFEVLSINYDHHIYKVKAFVYEYTSRAEIAISSVQNYTSEVNGLDFISESTFKATCNHSKLNGFNVELDFNSTIIIDECKVVEVEVHQDDKFINNWNSFWSGKDPSVLVYFYNFNFPKHIKYDEVVYAKFQYDYLTVYEKIWTHQESYGGEWVPDDRYTEYNLKEIKDREKVVSEYNNESKTIRVNKHSQELTFPTFYLGNRIKDKQFGDLDVEGQTESFNYDCSILLDSTYRIRRDGYGGKGPSGKLNQHYMELDYTTLDQVELIELHYKNEGILYKCQVVSRPIQNEEFDKVTAKPPNKENKFIEFLMKIGEFVLNLFGVLNPSKSLKIFVGAAVCILTIVLLPCILKIIALPFRILFKRE